VFDDETINGKVGVQRRAIPCQFDKNVKLGSQVAHVPCKRKSIKSIVSTTLKKTRPTFLDDNLNLRSNLDLGNDPNNSILMGLDSLMALDDVMNPFDFK
jgi:hypothetical protein